MSLDELRSRVLADPDDVETRAVYADALSERGDARGELVALGCALAAVPTIDALVASNLTGEALAAAAAQHRRMRVLGAQDLQRWQRELGHSYPKLLVDGVYAGFVTTLKMELETPADVAMLRDILRRTPIDDLTIRTQVDPGEPMHGVRRLSVDGFRPPIRAVNAFAKLRALSIASLDHVTPAEIAALAIPEELAVFAKDPALIVAIAKHRHLKRLRISSAPIDPLVGLDLDELRLGWSTSTTVPAGFRIPRKLDLQRSPTALFAMFADARALRELRVGIAPGVHRVLEAPRLESLVFVEGEGRKLDARTIAALSEARGLRHLDVLDTILPKLALREILDRDPLVALHAGNDASELVALATPTIREIRFCGEITEELAQQIVDRMPQLRRIVFARASVSGDALAVLMKLPQIVEIRGLGGVVQMSAIRDHHSLAAIA